MVIDSPDLGQEDTWPLSVPVARELWTRGYIVVRRDDVDEAVSIWIDNGMVEAGDEPVVERLVRAVSVSKKYTDG